MASVSELRLAAQLLAGPPASTPAAVARRLLAVQAQDPRGARLAVRARTTGLTSADVDRALTQERSLVVSWLNRGTLHLVRAEDYWWLHALTTPQLNNARRLAQEGVPPPDAERAAGVVEQALTAGGPLTRAQLRERVAAAGVRTEGQALVHILFLACKRGIAVRGPMAGREQAYVLARDWLGSPPASFDRGRALAELARRYLAGHGPASDADLARWAGVPLRDARHGLREIASSLVEHPDGLVSLAGAGEAYGLPPPRLLGPYEPVLLGWASRGAFVDPRHDRTVAPGGLFRPFALVAGRAAATWSLTGGNLTITPFGDLAEEVSAALAADACQVRRYLGISGAAPPGCSGSPAAG
jgi:hypothetical protein